MHVFATAPAGWHGCLNVCGGQSLPWMSVLMSQQPYLLRQALSLRPGAYQLECLGDQQVLGIYLSLPPQIRDYGHVPLHLVFSSIFVTVI